jgi:hypothetical protein
MDLIKFHPDNLSRVQSSELQELTKEDIKELAEAYPYMNAKLYIVKKGTQNPKSLATYRSLNSLLRSGHQFELTGSIHGDPVKSIEPKLVQELEKVDYIEPEQPIFQPINTNNESRKTPIKPRTRRGNTKID